MIFQVSFKIKVKIKVSILDNWYFCSIYEQIDEVEFSKRYGYGFIYNFQINIIGNKIS